MELNEDSSIILFCGYSKLTINSSIIWTPEATSERVNCINAPLHALFFHIGFSMGMGKIMCVGGALGGCNLHGLRVLLGPLKVAIKP